MKAEKPALSIGRTYVTKRTQRLLNVRLDWHGTGCTLGCTKGVGRYPQKRAIFVRQSRSKEKKVCVWFSTLYDPKSFSFSNPKDVDNCSLIYDLEDDISQSLCNGSNKEGALEAID